jgi:DNA replication protein DnaC
MIERTNQSISGATNLDDSEQEVCKDCFGTGTKIDPERGAMLCPCRRSVGAKNLFAAARIPPRYLKCSFESFKTEPNSSLDSALFQARHLVLDYPAVDRGILFMGPAGVGKTHLAVSIVKGLIEKGFGCIFTESGLLLKQIKDSYNPISKSSELSVLAPIYQADVLVLDELGAAVPSDWVRDTLYQIINTRYNQNRLTIFTTNYLDEARVPSPEGDPAPRPFSNKSNPNRLREMTTLEERIGSTLRSRLHEMCKKVMIEGEDYRTHMGRRRFDVQRSS